MKLLFAIPHYYDSDPGAGRRHGSQSGDANQRIEALTCCLTAIHQIFGRPQCTIDIARHTTVPANQLTAIHVDVIICTTGHRHLVEQIPIGASYFQQRHSEANPKLLGFECHAALRERLGDYDFYCYLEDDLILHDPLFFLKVGWFEDQFGEDAVLMPNRYEVAHDGIVHKAYVDGPIQPRATAAFQDINITPILTAAVFGQRFAFRRTTNPHSGGFFLTESQMAAWTRQPHFLDRDTRFIGPLESAATLGVMRNFRVYKPADENAAFLELEHFAPAFLPKIKHPEAVAAAEGAENRT